MASVTVTFDTKTLRDAYVAGAEAVRSGVINACRERLATLDAASPEAAAWREVEAACLALELPPQKRSPRPTHEADFRPLPSVAEVLAHNARTGGDCVGPGMWLRAGTTETEGLVRAVMICAALTDDSPNGERVVKVATNVDVMHDDRFRPITRRGAALPWPEVSR